MTTEGGVNDIDSVGMPPEGITAVLSNQSVIVTNQPVTIGTSPLEEENGDGGDDEEEP
jgi:hypothetical protein